MNRKKLSIIIPAYNAEKYLAQCLASLIKLDIHDSEIIVVNDGSTDNTESIIEECVKKDSRIINLKIKNCGVSTARNTGLDHASGDYVMFLDADDYLINDSINDLKNIVISSDYDFVAFSRYILEEARSPWNDKFYFEEPATTDKNKTDIIMFTDSHFNECWGKLYKKQYIDKYKIRFPKNVPIGEDMMFVMEYYSHCKTVFASNVPLVAYRQHGSSAMRKYDIYDRLKYTQNLYSYTKSYLPQKYIDEFWFYNFKILTNLCREYSAVAFDKDVIEQIYNSEMANDILANVKKSIIPLYRKHEFVLMKYKLCYISALYYHLKSTIKR